ncbi:MAG: hypothetical protein HY782_22235 [Chloroflexi bacterium]|nr:hypothetical protein [Chloroflexota bacterium]
MNTKRALTLKFALAALLAAFALLPATVAAEGPDSAVAQVQAQYNAALQEYAGILGDLTDTAALEALASMQNGAQSLQDEVGKGDYHVSSYYMGAIVWAEALENPALAEWRSPEIVAELNKLKTQLDKARNDRDLKQLAQVAQQILALFKPVEELGAKAREAEKKRDAAKAKVEDLKKQLAALQLQVATGQSKKSAVSTAPEPPPPEIGNNIVLSGTGNYWYLTTTDKLPPDAKVSFEINGKLVGPFGPNQRIGLYNYGPGPYNVVIIAERGGKVYRKNWGVFDPATKKLGAPPPDPLTKPADANKGSDKTAGNSSYKATAGDPVSTSIGEYYFALPLFALDAPLPIDLSLYYASSLDKNLGVWNDPFIGDRFTHNYHAALQRSENAIAIFFGSGQTLNFQRAGEAWQIAGEPIAYQLKETNKHYWLLDPIADLIFIFDKTHATMGTDTLTMIQDRNGNATTLLNDQSGRVVSIANNTGAALYFTYDRGRLTHVSDSSGRSVQFGYAGDDTALHLVAMTDTLGAKTTFTHTGPVTNTAVAAVTYPKGNTPYSQQYAVNTIAPEAQRSGGEQYTVNSQKDALGNVTKLAANEVGTTIGDPTGATRQHTYTNVGLSGLKDAAGKSAAFEYDAQGRLSAVTDRQGGKTQVAYHASGKIAALTNANGGRVSFTYAPQEQLFLAPDGEQIVFGFTTLTRIDYPDKANEQFAYDVRGNIVSHTDATGKTWKYTYDTRGQILTITNPTNGVITYTYNADATVASFKDSETGETKLGYDHAQRLNKITRADGSTVEYIYDQNDRLTLIVEPNFRFTRFEYDANDNLVKLFDANGKATTFEYDAMDRVTKITDRVGQTANASTPLSTSLTYDQLGHLASVTDPTGVATQYGYDPRGWLNAITRGGNVWKLGYDDEGIVTSVTSPLGNTAKFQNDKLGLLASSTDPLGNTSTLARDAMNRMISVTDALKRETKYGYDANGWLNSVTAPVVGEAKYERDVLGNATKITDLNGQAWTFAYSPMGRLQAATDPLKQTKKYAYDNLGRVSQVTYADGVTGTAVYDAAWNPTRVSYSDGTQFVFAYDAENNLIGANDVFLVRDAEGRVINTLINPPPVAGLATGGDGGGYGATGGDGGGYGATGGDGGGYAATYDSAGRLKTATYPLGGAKSFTVTYTYDAKTGLLANVSDSLSKAQVDFTYDRDHRLVGMARSNKVSTTLTWDNAARLTGVRDGSITDLQYTFDAAGQVTTAKLQMPLNPATASNFQLPTSNLQFDAASQISTTGYKYDARGRLTQSPDQQFKWNGASQLVSYQSTVNSQQSTTMLTYNGLGDVASRTDGTATVRYAYNYALGLAPIVAEMPAPPLPSTPAPLRFYVWSPSGTLLYAIENAKPLFYHFDRTGSTLALTDADGRVTDAYAYDPQGKMLGHTGKSTQPFTFTGKWGVRRVGNAGASVPYGDLYQMRARYYDATTARFISRDPSGPQIDDPTTLDPYAYAHNNPLKYVDVDGRIALTPEEMAFFGDPAPVVPNAAAQPSALEMALAKFEKTAAENNKMVLGRGAPAGSSAPDISSDFFETSGKTAVNQSSKVGASSLSTAGSKLARVGGSLIRGAAAAVLSEVYMYLACSLMDLHGAPFAERMRQRLEESARQDREREAEAKRAREEYEKWYDENEARKKAEGEAYAKKMQPIWEEKARAWDEAERAALEKRVGGASFLGGRVNDAANQAEIDRQVKIMAAFQRLLNFLGAGETVRTKLPR